MTALWLMAPVALVAGVALAALLVRRLAEAAVELEAHAEDLQRVRLATITVEDDLAVLRASLAERHRR
jgi:hypothetical protein